MANSEIVTYVCRHGLFSHFSSDAVIGRSLDLYGEWAEDEIALLSQYLSKGSVVIDVGANVGTHSIGFARIVGSEGTVFAIEGEPTTYCLLAHNIVGNNLLGNVVPIQMLCGRESRVLDYSLNSVSGENAGAKSFVDDLKRDGVSVGQARLPISVARLDDLNFIHCDVLKIDVEGMEPDVLYGARGMIKSFHPVVYFEHAVADAGQLEKCADVLLPLGYKMYYHFANPFASNNFNHSAANIFGGSVELNILALPPGKDLALDLHLVSEPWQSPARPTLDSQIGGVPNPDYMARFL